LGTPTLDDATDQGLRLRGVSSPHIDLKTGVVAGILMMTVMPTAWSFWHGGPAIDPSRS